MVTKYPEMNVKTLSGRLFFINQGKSLNRWHSRKMKYLKGCAKFSICSVVETVVNQ